MERRSAMLGRTAIFILSIIASFSCASGSAPLAVARGEAPTPAGGAYAGEKTIEFVITSKMWDFLAKKAVDTPQAVISKVIRCFEMWGSVPGSGLKFEYGGLVAAAYDSPEAIPKDGRIYIVLNGDYPFAPLSEGGPAGTGGYSGSIPGDYKGGHVFMSTKVAGMYTLRFNILAHEVGHALGLGHSTTNSSVMFCGSQAWNDAEFMHASEQDRLNLGRLWPAKGKIPYIVSGTITGDRASGAYGVYVVDIANGHTYSALADGGPSGKFTYAVATGGPGNYRVVAAAYPWSTSEPMPESPSWYLAGSASTNDPYAGTVLRVAEGEFAVKGVDIAMVKRKAPFNLFWSIPATWNEPEKIVSFLRPGEPVPFDLMFNRGTMSAIEAYGSDPDIVLSGLAKRGDMYRLSVRAKAGAAPGDRFVIARGDPGQPVQAGLIGIHLVSRRPDWIPVDPRSKSEDDWIMYQIEGGCDFSIYNWDF